MRNKIYTLVAFMMATLTMTSCLKDDDEKNSVSYKDTAILSFSLGQLKQVRDTVAKNGSDSSYTANFNAAKVKFYIDQEQGLIYNPDSLPYGTKASNVLAKIVTKNSGTVVIKSTTDEKYSYYNSNDSINFSTPRFFRVYSNQGSEYRDYKISVNVHKQKGNVFSWQALQANSNFSSFTAMKAVSTGSKVFVFGSNGSQTIAYAADKDNGNNWTKLSKVFTANAYKSVAVQGTKLFVIDNGVVYSSTDGSSWTTVATNSNLKLLVAASPAELFALSTSGTLLASKDNGTTWTNESLDSNASLLPVNNINASLTALTADMYRVQLVGTLADGTKNVSWTKLSYRQNEAWSYVVSNADKFQLPLYKTLAVVGYDKATLALGVDTNGKLASMLLSRDGGITWKSDKNFIYPTDLQPATAFTATVDSDEFLWIISGTKVWRGRLNRVGWELNLSRL